MKLWHTIFLKIPFLKKLFSKLGLCKKREDTPKTRLELWVDQHQKRGIEINKMDLWMDLVQEERYSSKPISSSIPAAVVTHSSYSIRYWCFRECRVNSLNSERGKKKGSSFDRTNPRVSNPQYPCWQPSGSEFPTGRNLRFPQIGTFVYQRWPWTPGYPLPQTLVSVLRNESYILWWRWHDTFRGEVGRAVQSG